MSGSNKKASRPRTKSSKILIFILLVFFVLLLTTCSQVFSKLDNPADPDSTNYQGYEAIVSIDAIQTFTPAADASFDAIPSQFIVSKVVGADFYYLQISSTADFTAPLLLDKSDYPNNKMSPGSVILPRDTVYYWRAKAYKAGTWGAWTAKASFVLQHRYSVIYDGNGNTGGNVPTDSTKYLPSDTVTVLGNTGSLTRTGYTFAGWNTEAAGTGISRAVASTFTMGSANVILYAKWSPTYTVTYDGNGNTGGSIPTDSSTYLAGATVIVMGNTGSLTKTGYAFSGWNTEAAGTGTSRAAASTFAIGSANVILYAKWITPAIGDTGPAGGLVFYDKGSYSSGWRYMEAAPSDQSTGIRWYNGSYVTTGATATGIGSGIANTATIVSVQGVGSYAASLCANLVLGGYDDWFLPSKDELNLMYTNLKVAGRGSFSSAWYWSSSEYVDLYAWVQDFVGGDQGYGGKNYSFYVRAVRAF